MLSTSVDSFGPENRPANIKPLSPPYVTPRSDAALDDPKHPDPFGTLLNQARDA